MHSMAVGAAQQNSEGATVDAQRETEVVDRVHKDLFIAGKWQSSAGGGTFTVDDPATGAVIA